jgi:hypothetical protein
MEIQTYSATTQECVQKKFKWLLEIRILFNKAECTYRKCLFLELYLEISHTFLFAGDFFVKPEVLRHFPRTSFANFATNVLRNYVFIPRELH